MPDEETSSLTENQFELSLVLHREGAPDLPAAFQITPTGITIRDDMSYDEYLEGLRSFKRLKDWTANKLEMDLSAYISWGQARFTKEKVLAGLAQLEFDMPTATRAIDINTIPEEMRHESLKSEHYVILARSGLKAKEKERWSRTAHEQSLSPAQLKASIAAGEVVDPKTTKALAHGIFSVHGLSMEFGIWSRRFAESQKCDDLIGAFLKVESAVQDEILNELKPIAEFFITAKAARSKKQPKKKPARKPAKKKAAK